METSKKLFCLCQSPNGHKNFGQNFAHILSVTLRQCMFCISGRSDAERVRNSRERAGQESEAVPASDLRYDPLASQQQVCEGPTAGCRPHLPHCRRHENVSRGKYFKSVLSLSVFVLCVAFSSRLHGPSVESRPPTNNEAWTLTDMSEKICCLLCRKN